MRTNLKNNNSSCVERRFPVARAGFTLVEMLVAVGLVVLMMSLFASVFQIATSVMSKQKGFAENDQRARTLMIVLKADLDKRTYRRVVPLWKEDADNDGVLDSGEDINGDGNLDVFGPEDPATQQGFFSYSENDPDDDTDDVLHFTVNTSNVSKNLDTSPLYGRATVLRHPTPRGPPRPPAANSVDDTLYLNRNPNQPEADDGQAVLDNAASSDSAEVVYFLRNRVLYRRVMLIRKPVDTTASINPDDSPSSGAPLEYLTPTYAYVSATNSIAPSPYSFLSAGLGGFWADFDFAAYNDGTGVRFHGVNASLNALNNAPGSNTNAVLSSFLTGAVGSTVSAPAAMATPNLRFGHSIVNGRPREFATTPFTTGGSTFIGRFTHEETSHSTFTYPGVGPGNTGTTPPFANDPWNLTVALNANGIASAYANGPRRGEDILLTNVYSFDIKIFDDMQEIDRNGNNTVQASENRNRVNNSAFDTVMDFRDVGYAAQPGKQGYYCSREGTNRLYGPKTATATTVLGTDTQPGGAGDDDGDGTANNATETGWPGTDDIGNRLFDTWHSDIVNYLGMPPYRPLDVGPDGMPGRVGDDDGDGIVDYTDSNSNGQYDVGEPFDLDELGWDGSDDRHPVRAIQIKIRYLDIPSNQMRQMTIVHSLID